MIRKNDNIEILKRDRLPDSLREIKSLFDAQSVVTISDGQPIKRTFPLSDADIDEIEKAFHTDNLSEIRIELSKHFSPERIDKLNYIDLLRHARAVIAKTAQDARHAMESKTSTANKPPLGDTAQRIYEIIRALPKGQGIIARKICDILAKDHKIILSEDSVYKYKPQLLERGVQHAKRIGFYCED